MIAPIQGRILFGRKPPSRPRVLNPGKPKIRDSNFVVNPAEPESQKPQDSLELYLYQIGQYPLLSKEDEVYLGQQMHKGRDAQKELNNNPNSNDKSRLRRLIKIGRAAEEKFTQCNLRLVVSIAKKYQNKGVPLLDLIQFGNLGLMRAVLRYDWRNGAKFSTFAHRWIKNAIERGRVKDAHTIQRPIEFQNFYNLIQHRQDELALILKKTPTIQELANALDIEPDELSEILDLMHSTNTLTLDLQFDDGETVQDSIECKKTESPFYATMKNILREHIDKILETLSDRDQDILKRRYLDDEESCSSIAKDWGVTGESIRMAEKRLLKRLKTVFEENGLDLYY